MLDFKHFILSQWLIKKVLFCFALLCACVFKILMISCFFSMVAGLYLVWVILCKSRSLCLTLFPVNDSRFLMMIQLCYSECKIGIYLPKKLWVITSCFWMSTDVLPFKRSRLIQTQTPRNWSLIGSPFLWFCTLNVLFSLNGNLLYFLHLTSYSSVFVLNWNEWKHNLLGVKTISVASDLRGFFLMFCIYSEHAQLLEVYMFKMILDFGANCWNGEFCCVVFN
jgi:hypothetical protein